MKVVRNYLWIVALLFAIAFIGLGSFFIYKGLDAKREIKARLTEQQAFVGADAVQFGGTEGALIDNPLQAQAQADMIKLHTLGKYGPWSKIPQTETATRTSFAQGVTLQTALNMSVLAWGVADLALGTGAVILLMGAATLGIAVPALFWARHAEEEVVREAKKAYAAAPAYGAAGDD